MATLLSLPHIIDQLSLTRKKVVLVMGNFNTLHPGHIRLLKFAKDCGDKLVVGINSDSVIDNPDYMDEAYRVEVLAALGIVDYCFINTEHVEEVVQQLKPNVVVKGFEYQSKENPEKTVIEACGGKLIFCSGDASFNASSYLKSASPLPIISTAKLNGFLKRHKISKSMCKQTVEKYNNLHVAVIGDVIIDQYIQCNAVGMSQEDPTIVVTPNSKSLFLGGAGITAAHAKGLGAKSVSLFTVTGVDDYSEYTQSKLGEYGVEAIITEDDTRPTNLKTRYRVGNKTMLRVNEVRNHDIEDRIQQRIFSILEQKISQLDVLVFSDFNYGVLPQTLVDRITQLCRAHNVVIAADSQSSSQVGDISRFTDVDLVTPTEREARLALNNAKDGLVLLAEKLRQKCRAKHIVITLGEDGAFLHKLNPELSHGDSWLNDKLAALAEKAVDPAGAGDCFLASATLALAVGADFWVATFLGSVAAACQVNRVGNMPLMQSELLQVINEIEF
ncbi:PfkB family carbohydrate kinase [Catenovulum sp. 2E275]|uniref:PfkB family carbohydrate kinase n=1 Tax=Catenovulum sp. 2E275 TaxID=2980497 RepID=UPI0021D25AA2|nr:PfkB family carbohydrate kinase [Catenovulum sp. 2E275]MCU4674729.1 PfkB family carbohydrate kinase [Catenovulum sp. 2E275]